MSAGAVDDRRIGLTIDQPIGPDQAKAPAIDIGKHFGRVAYDAKGREVQIQQPQVQAQQAKPQDPQDPWANTGQDKNSVMDGIRATEHNLGTACDNMAATKGTCYAMEMGAQTMKLGGELLGALGNLAKSELGGQEQTADATASPHLTRSFSPAPQPGGMFT